jgi:hypothetical protein
MEKISKADVLSLWPDFNFNSGKYGSNRILYPKDSLPPRVETKHGVFQLLGIWGNFTSCYKDGDGFFTFGEIVVKIDTSPKTIEEKIPSIFETFS